MKRLQYQKLQFWIAVMAITITFCSCASTRYHQLKKQGVTIHEDFKNLCINVPFNNFTFAMANSVLPMGRAFAILPKGVSRKVIHIKTVNLNLRADIYIPKELIGKNNLPCLFYLHGGGGGYKAAPYQAKQVATYAKEVGCVVIMPDYHNLPKAVYPLPQIEMLNTYRWVIEHADELGIDINRIATGGDSAGGYLSAILCCDIEAEKLPRPICQILVYPGLDSSCSSNSAIRYTFTPIWDANKNVNLWHNYANGYPKEETSMLYRPLPEHLPATYIEPAQWDCLHDEAILLGKRLLDAGIYVEMNPTQGTIHGFDVNMKSSITKAAIAHRIDFLRKYLYK